MDRKLGLYGRLQLAVSLLTLISFMAMFLHSLADINDLHQKNREDHLRHQASVLARTTLDALAAEDFEILERSVKATLFMPDYAYAALVRPDGRILTHTDLDFIGKQVSTLTSGHAGQLRSLQFDGRPVVEAMHPAIIGSMHMANAHVAYYADVGQLVSWEAYWHLFGIGLLLMLLMLGGGYMLVRRFVGPILTLTSIVKNMSPNAKAAIPEKLTRHDDELSNLARAFKSMATRLHDAYRELELERANLEQRVIERTQELARTRDAALRATRAKSMFLATMSHEIRTPMNGVLSMLQMVLSDELKPAQFEQLKLAHDSAQGLLTIIDDILDFSKIEAGKLTLERAEFSLQNVVQTVVQLLQQRAVEKGIVLDTEMDDFPLLLSGDALRIRQVLFNLIGNAIKFTHNGGVHLRVEMLDLSEDGMRVGFSVKDSGIGMTPEQKAVIFDRYTQADDTISQQYGGTGLGLSICRQLVELMGGKIEVESAPGVGSRFHFELTFAVSGVGGAEVEERAEREMSEAAAPPHANRILLLENDDNTQRLAQGVLCSFGVDLDLAGDIEDVLALEEKVDYDLVFVSCSLLRDDGFSQVRKLRAYFGQQRCPVLVGMVDGALPEAGVRCVAEGLEDYLLKPVKRADLEAVLVRHLDDGTIDKDDNLLLFPGNSKR